MKDDERYIRELTLLKKSKAAFNDSRPDGGILECFDNRYPGREYEVTFACPEFTCRCPVTDQPDFGSVTIRYVPAKKCIESKSLKFYLFSYRNYNTFHEESVNRILDDIVDSCSPRRAEVVGEFKPRGGISIRVTAGYEAN